jgi:hypothetical protein
LGSQNSVSAVPFGSFVLSFRLLVLKMTTNKHIPCDPLQRDAMKNGIVAKDGKIIEDESFLNTMSGQILDCSYLPSCSCCPVLMRGARGFHPIVNMHMLQTVLDEHMHT